uniref:Uncharacterized protein n=1 Tax=Rhizophora mucronata TaxID=61149 RepID=A0A2P2N6A0_RHIMU
MQQAIYRQRHPMLSIIEEKSSMFSKLFKTVKVMVSKYQN